MSKTYSAELVTELMNSLEGFVGKVGIAYMFGSLHLEPCELCKREGILSLGSEEHELTEEGRTSTAIFDVCIACKKMLEETP